MRLTTMRTMRMVALAALFAAAGCSSSKKAADATFVKPTLDGKVTDHGSKDIAGATEVTLEADDFYFAPTFIKAAPGSTITVHLKNESKSQHTFTSTALKIDQTLDPDQKVDVKVTLPASGPTPFFCRFHQSTGMQGAFVVS